MLCKVGFSRSGSSSAGSTSQLSRSSVLSLRRHLLDTGDAHDMHGAEHDGLVPFGKRNEHRVLDDRCILRVIDEKDIPAAAPNLERLKSRLPKIHSNLLKHFGTIPLGEAKTSVCSLLLRLQRVAGLPEFGGGAGAGVGFAGAGVGFEVLQVLCKVWLSRG